MTEKMYEMVCKERFDKIDLDNKEIISTLKGTNGTPGLCERMRTMEKTYTKVIAAAIFVLCAVVLQIIETLFNWLK
jgi:hypothetical protein